MVFVEFDVERFMSENEQTVEFNLFAESGVLPMTARDVLDLAGRDQGEATLQNLLGAKLGYPEVNGLVEMRRAIAKLYGEKNPDNVLVTVGASEANYLLAACLVEPGEHVAILVPTYKQFYGCALNRGAHVSEFYLDEGKGWGLDVQSLHAAVRPSTKVIALVNPNNPTGRSLDLHERAAIVQAAKRSGAWLIVDEVYAGAETAGDQETPSFYGMYEKCICVNSLSKAYGLPGLRIGWAIGPTDIITQAWRHHEYATISTSMLGQRLACIALSESGRPKVIARTRKLIRQGWPLIEKMLAENSDLLSVAAKPQASAMCFLRYNLHTDSRTIALRLAREKSILIVPGSAFGMERHLRFTYALPEEEVKVGIERLVSLLRQIQREESARL